MLVSYRRTLIRRFTCVLISCVSLALGAAATANPYPDAEQSTLAQGETCDPGVNALVHNTHLHPGIVLNKASINSAR